MTKVKITADAVLEIIKGIFNDEDINEIISDQGAPIEYQGKTIQEVLNVEYYTFKHRPLSSEDIIAEKIKQQQPVINQMMALGRSFCLLSVGDIERLFSKDVDMATLNTTLEYWIQTDKIKFLEDLIEDCNIKLSGWRVPVVFGAEKRQAVVIFDNPIVTDVQTGTVCGEMAVCEVKVNILLYPDVVSYKDYEVKFNFVNDKGAFVENCIVPVASFSFVNTMTQKAVPQIGQQSNVGSINLSRAISFVLVFEGYNNEFINYIANKSLTHNSAIDNNQVYEMVVTRLDSSFKHMMVIKDHQVIVNADTGNETHTLALVTKGI